MDVPRGHSTSFRTCVCLCGNIASPLACPSHRYCRRLIRLCFRLDILVALSPVHPSSSVGCLA
eukprot:15456297-Alexandrium_andersonii.AAC.1